MEEGLLNGSYAAVHFNPIATENNNGLGNRTRTTQKYNILSHSTSEISRGGRSEALGRSLCVIRVGIHQW